MEGASAWLQCRECLLGACGEGAARRRGSPAPGPHTCLTLDVRMSTAPILFKRLGQVAVARTLLRRCTSREAPSGRLQFEHVGIATECRSRRFAVPARGGL